MWHIFLHVIFIYECFSRLNVDKRSYDPIDYECIDNTDFWVVEEEPLGELDYDQLETMLDDQDEEPHCQT